MKEWVEVNLTFKGLVIGQLALLPLLTAVGLWLLGSQALTVGASIAFAAGWMMMTSWFAGSRTAAAMAFTTFVIFISGVIVLMGFSFIKVARYAPTPMEVSPAQVIMIVVVVTLSVLVALWVAMFLIAQSQSGGWRTPVWSFRIPSIGPRSLPPVSLFVEQGLPFRPAPVGEGWYN